MIEPNMATMLVYLMTDAELPKAALRPMLRRVVDRTFNCMSIDTDTSTSDTVVLMANGLAGKVRLGAFEKGLLEVCEYLTKEIARNGEGATKLDHRRRQPRQDAAQAKRVAKFDRQFAAGQNRRLWLRSQLGPSDHGRRQSLRYQPSIRPKLRFASATPTFSKKARRWIAISRRCGNISGNPKSRSASILASAKPQRASGAAI